MTKQDFIRHLCVRSIRFAIMEDPLTMRMNIDDPSWSQAMLLFCQQVGDCAEEMGILQGPGFVRDLTLNAMTFSLRDHPTMISLNTTDREFIVSMLSFFQSVYQEAVELGVIQEELTEPTNSRGKRC